MVNPLILNVLYLFFLGSLTGCGIGQDSTILNALRAEQSLSGVVIARKNYHQLEMITVTQELNTARVILPLSSLRPDGLVSEQKSEEWVSSCDSKLCTLSNLNTGSKQMIDAENIISTPQWSPDGRLAFFVRQVKGFRVPLRCSLEDEHDLIVYDPKTQHEVRATVLCGGYPYSSLHWYTIKR